MKITHLLFSLGLAGSLFGQTPCVNGTAGGYSCNGYDLQSRVTLNVLSGGQNVSGNDCWGWTDPTSGKEYAIMGYSEGTGFVDISDPVNPIYLGRIPTETWGSVWRDIKVYQNHAFIVADNVGDHGMQVFDLTRLRTVTSPQVFTPDHVYHGVPSCHNIVINESQPYAYLVGCSNYGGGPTILDISNPLAPVELGGHEANGYTHDAQVVTYSGPDPDYQGKQILIASNGNFGSNNFVVFLDVTDGANPTFISNITYNVPGYTHQGWLSEDQRYFILGDEIDEMDSGNNTRTIIFNVQDLDNPQVVSEYYGPTPAIDHNGYVRDNKFYLANYTAGMRVVDISTVGSSTNTMTEIGHFDSYSNNNLADFDGAWSVYPYFASKNILISDMSGGLFIVKESQTMATTDWNENSFQILPNPATNYVQIRSNNSAMIEDIQLVNTVGQVLFSKSKINQKNFQLDLTGVAKGIYMVKINQSISKKLVVK
jgi:choice-of-anchor B domain-containing protein